MDFMKTAKYWIGFSVLVTLLGVVSLFVRGLNLGIDFTGGSLLDLRFGQPQTIESVREALGPDHQKAGIKLASLDGREVLVTTAALPEEERVRLFEILKARLGDFEALRVEQVQGVISGELTRQALGSVAVASVLQLIYITFRFEFRFGVAAVIALLHDSLITLGLFSLLGTEVGAPFIAAILTVLGYSIMDTIVIFDRIRENLKFRKKESLRDLINRSISQSLRRSLLTSATTLVATLAILIFGGQTTKDFALALAIGIAAGTYSSIFVASPIWLWWNEAVESRKRAARSV